MRITIEPTSTDTLAYIPYYKVIMESSCDDLTAADMLDMLKRAAVAWGYNWSNIFDEDGESQKPLRPGDRS